jgi:hypothetical protein
MAAVVGWCAAAVAALPTTTPSASPSASATPKPSPSPVFPPAAPNRTEGLERAAFDALNVGPEALGAPRHKEEWSSAEVEAGWVRYATKYDHHLILFQRLDRLSWPEFRALNAYASVPKKVLTNAFQAYKGGAHQLVEFHGRLAGRIPNLSFTQFKDINVRVNATWSPDDISSGWNKYQRGASHNMTWQVEDASSSAASPLPLSADDGALAR